MMRSRRSISRQALSLADQWVQPSPASCQHLYGESLCHAVQGNRVKVSCGDEACEEVVVPGGNLAAEAEGILARRLSDQVVGHML